MDLSLGMIVETLKHIDNSYNIPHFHGEGSYDTSISFLVSHVFLNIGKVAKTHLAPTKPYRGAGIPQGIGTFLSCPNSENLFFCFYSGRRNAS